ncbi:MAG: GIY-YIG nuclease family protein [bacterium]
MFYVYILYSETHDRYYVGQTDNLDARLARHNAGEVFATTPYGPWKLVYQQRYATRSEAMMRERSIKKKKSRKYLEYLLNRQSPDSHRD